jgi:hypothetical protein
VKNPVAKSLRSPHLRQRVVKVKRTPGRDIADDFIDTLYEHDPEGMAEFERELGKIIADKQLTFEDD